jgi:DNA-binding MarR family transcriptional regulator
MQFTKRSSTFTEVSNEAIEAAKRANLGQLLLRSARLFDTMAFSRWSKHHRGIRRAHLQLMPHLDLEGTRITELARRAEITKQAVGQLVTDMEEAGYVERRPDPSDQRAKLVVLTRRGRKAMLEGLAVFKGIEAELREAVGAETVDGLVAGLAALLPALEPQP